MTQHTAEPWVAVDCLVALQVRSGVTDVRIADLRSHVPRSAYDQLAPPRKGAEANAERLVACVNACVGLPTAALTNGALADLLNAIDDILAAGESDDDDFTCASEDAARLNDLYRRLRGEG